MEAPTGVGEPAGFWRRFGGVFIDGLVVGVVDTILRYAIGNGPGTGLGFVVSAAYFTYFHGRTGQTPGNAVLGIRVIDVRDNPGQPIGYSRAFIRWLVSIVSTIVQRIAMARAWRARYATSASRSGSTAQSP